MDIKSSPEGYHRVAGVPGLDMAPIMKSVSILMEGKIDFEFRTTAVKTLHSIDDFEAIGRWIAGAPRYFIQSYKDEGEIICPGMEAFSRAELEEILAASDPESLLLPLDSLFADRPFCKLNEAGERKLRNGASLRTGKLADGEYRVYGPSGEFLALCAVTHGELRAIKSFFSV